MLQYTSMLDTKNIKKRGVAKKLVIFLLYPSVAYFYPQGVDKEKRLNSNKLSKKGHLMALFKKVSKMIFEQKIGSQNSHIIKMAIEIFRIYGSVNWVAALHVVTTRKCMIN